MQPATLGGDYHVQGRNCYKHSSLGSVPKWGWTTGSYPFRRYVCCAGKILKATALIYAFSRRQLYVSAPLWFASPSLFSYATQQHRPSMDDGFQRAKGKRQRRTVRQQRYPHPQPGEGPVRCDQRQLPSANGVGRWRLGGVHGGFGTLLCARENCVHSFFALP